MVRRIFLDRRIRLLLVCVAIVVVGVLQETWLIPHYFAAITPAFYAVGLQMMRHLRHWKPGGQPVGTAIQPLHRNCVHCTRHNSPLGRAASPSAPPLAERRVGLHMVGPGQMGLARKHIEPNSITCPASSSSSSATLRTTVHWMSGSITPRISITRRLSGHARWTLRITWNLFVTTTTAPFGSFNQTQLR